LTQVRKGGPTIGCLMIEDLSSGGQKLSGLSVFLEKMGVHTELFRWDGREDIHVRLQNAFFQVRSENSKACIAACGAGILGAVALAVQLPVERMVFIEGHSSGQSEKKLIHRQVSRLYRFSRRNAAFCISDILRILPAGEDSGKAVRATMKGLVNCRIDTMDICERAGNKICPNGEHLPEMPIYRFLTAGEIAKSLAENSEMCIIYE